MIWLARAHITLKPLVNDPPGLAIRGALLQLGYSTVESVRAGKYFEVRLDADSAETARARVVEMCQKLLANPVIEDFQVEVESAPVRQSS